MGLTNPSKLNFGDTIGIISPSAGLAGIFPHRVDKGVSFLEKAGFKVIFSTHAKECVSWVSAPAAERAADMHEMFLNPEVKAIICASGGDHSNQILKYLDFDLIRKHPKIFVGYSDITVLHYALASQCGLRTFYGPCLLPEFGEYPETLSYTWEYFKKALMFDVPLGNVDPSQEWTDELMDWRIKADLTRARSLLPSNGYEWWQEGEVKAPIWGGCMPSINHLAGTKYWVSLKDKILFIDLPEDKPGVPFPLSSLDSFFADLDNQKVFAEINGLIIGRPYCYGEKEKTILQTLIRNYTKDYNYPILYNLNIGHADPIITLPMGVTIELNSKLNKFGILDSGVSN